MKKIEGFLLKGCAYTVLLLVLLYIALATIGNGNEGISVYKFFLVLGYGMMISASELIYSAMKCNVALKLLTHYGILLVGFVAVYALSGFTGTVTAMRIFVIIVLFTLLYAAILGIVKLISGLVKKFDHAIDNAPHKPQPETAKYQSRFSQD